MIDQNVSTRELIAKKDWDRLAGRLCDLDYAQERADTGKIYDLLLEMEAAAVAIPSTHPAAKVINVLARSLRRNATLIARHPAATFQCFWNSCWWYDCSGLEAFAESLTGSPAMCMEGTVAAGPVSRLMESWRSQRDATGQSSVWIRSLLPPGMTFGDNLRIDIPVDTGSGYPVALAINKEHVVAWFRRQDDTIEPRVWKVQTGEPVGNANIGEWQFSDPSLSPDQRRKATCGGEGGGWGHPIRISDAQTGAEVTAFPVDDDHNISNPVFSADGTLVAASGYGVDYEGYVYICNLRTGPPAQVVQLRSAAHAVTVSPDGRRFLVGYSEGLIEIRTRTRALVQNSIPAHDASIVRAAFSTDGKRIASISWDGSLRVWDLAVEPTYRKFQPHPDDLAEAVFSPNGNRLVTRSMNGTLWLWDGNTGKPIRCLRRYSFNVEEGGDTRCALYVGDHMIISVARDGGVWAASDGVRLADVAERIFGSDSIQFTSDGKRFALWSELSFLEEAAVITIHDIRISNSPDSFGDVFAGELEMSPGEPEVAGAEHEISMAEDGETQTRRLRGRIELARIETNAGDVDACAFSSDSTLLASIGTEGWLKVWDWQTGTEIFSAQLDQKLLRNPTPPDGAPATRLRKTERVRFVDQDTLAVAVGETHLQLWKFRSGELLKTVAWPGTLSDYPGQAAYYAVCRGDEICVVLAETGEEVAWLPCGRKLGIPLRLIAHPNGLAWVGLLDARLMYFSLEPEYSCHFARHRHFAK